MADPKVRRGVWLDPAFAALACIARGTHYLAEGRSARWCGMCETGLCNDCGLPVFYHEECAWYHHIYAAVDCFLSSFRCPEREGGERSA